jgi:hypothetical protein
MEHTPLVLINRLHYRKKYEKQPKRPWQRLLESPSFGEETKAKLRHREGFSNSVKLKGLFDRVVADFLKDKPPKG